MRIHVLESFSFPVEWPRYWNRVLLVLAVMLIAWGPFSGGARFPTLLLVMVGTGMLLTSLSFMRAQRAIRRWTMVFLLLWLPMWLSLLHSVSVKATLAAVGWFSLFYLAGLALIFLMRQSINRVLFARCITWVMVFWILDSAIQYLFGLDVLGVPKTPDGRIVGMFHDLHQGILMLAVLPLIFYHLQAEHPWKAWSLLLASGIVMALSGARGYLYLYTLMLLLGLWRLQPSWRVWFATCALLLTVVLSSSFLNPQLARFKLENTQAIAITELSTFDRLNRALSYRLHLWETGWHMWQAEPVTGIGSNNFKRAYQQYATRADDPFVINPTHTHNIYVEWLAETGLLGGMALLAIIFLCVRWFKQADISSQHQAWPYAMPLMAFFFPINTTQPMLVPWWFPVLVLLMCAYIASLESEHDDA